MPVTNLHICLKNGAGYNLPDHYLALINQLLSRDIKITFLQEDYGTSKSFFDLIKLLSKNKNFTFFLIDPSPIGIRGHRQYLNILKQFESKKPSLFITTSDFTILDRYLIKFANLNNIKIGVLQTCILNQLLLAKYNSGHSKEISNIFKKYSKQRKKVGIKLITLKIINKINRNIEKTLLRIQHNFLYPSLLGYGFFLNNFKDKYAFCSGRSDFVICRSIGDCNILKNGIGGKTKYEVVTMPLLSKNSKLIEVEKVLFLMSSINTELTNIEIEYWVNLGLFLFKNLNVKIIDIRLHPRTDEKLKWPQKLEKKLKKSGIKINISKKDNKSIAEIANQYKGFISAFSGAVRVCCEQSEGFVTCILNLSGRKNEKPWMLGDVGDISIINAGEKLSKEMFIRKKSISKKGIPLIELLLKYCD